MIRSNSGPLLAPLTSVVFALLAVAHGLSG